MIGCRIIRTAAHRFRFLFSPGSTQEQKVFFLYSYEGCSLLFLLFSGVSFCLSFLFILLFCSVLWVFICSLSVHLFPLYPSILSLSIHSLSIHPLSPIPISIYLFPSCLSFLLSVCLSLHSRLSPNHSLPSAPCLTSVLLFSFSIHTIPLALFPRFCLFLPALPSFLSTPLSPPSLLLLHVILISILIVALSLLPLSIDLLP